MTIDLDELERKINDSLPTLGDWTGLRELIAQCREVKRERDELRALLERIRQWDQLVTAADGRYWEAEINTALAQEPKHGHD